MTYKLKIDLSTRVLVVDDHMLTREMILSILRGLGLADVTLAESGEQAFGMLKTRRIDAVICDWNMPNGSGIELLRLMRADPRFVSIPFLMLTAEAYRENVVAAVKAGVTDYIAKPFTAETLAQKLESILSPRPSA